MRGITADSDENESTGDDDDLDTDLNGHDDNRQKEDMLSLFEATRLESEKKKPPPPDWALCPITLCVMTDPYTTPSGRSFDKLNPFKRPIVLYNRMNTYQVLGFFASMPPLAAPPRGTI
jgi:hypothetical protein